MILSIKNVLLVGQQNLFKTNINSAALDSRILLGFALNYSHEQLIKNSDKIISENEFISFQNLIQRRANFEPISYITSKKEFWGLEFEVNNATLIPRPDSETLIESVIKFFPDQKLNLKIIDLGTGSGCLLLTLLSIYNNANGVGIDISFDALEIAKKNCKNLLLDNRAKFIKDNWAEEIKESFDIVISNPPYISINDKSNLALDVQNYEPHLALFAGIDGLDCYRLIAKKLSSLLNDNGYGFLEIGINQEEEVSIIMKNAGLNVVSYVRDLAKIVRCIIINKN